MPDEITVTRTFSAARERVWQAFTARENFAVWFGTEAVQIPLDTLVWDPTPGTSWSAVMSLPDGSTKGWVGAIVEVTPESNFVFTLTDNLDEPEATVPVRIVFAEAELAGSAATRVTLTQVTPGFTAEARAALEGGYGAFFDTIETLLTRQV